MKIYVNSVEEENHDINGASEHMSLHKLNLNIYRT